MTERKLQKDKQRSTKHTHKTRDRVTRTPLKTGDELRCSERISSSCSTSGNRCVNLVTKLANTSHEWGKDRKVWASRREILFLLLMHLAFLASEDFDIIWLSNMLVLSIPGEGYSRNSYSPVNWTSMFLFLVTCSQNYIEKCKGEGLYI
jgi:hypothetical protein